MFCSPGMTENSEPHSRHRLRARSISRRPLESIDVRPLKSSTTALPSPQILRITASSSGAVARSSSPPSTSLWRFPLTTSCTPKCFEGGRRIRRFDITTSAQLSWSAKLPSNARNASSHKNRRARNPTATLPVKGRLPRVVNASVPYRPEHRSVKIIASERGDIGSGVSFWRPKSLATGAPHALTGHGHVASMPGLRAGAGGAASAHTREQRGVFAFVTFKPPAPIGTADKGFGHLLAA
jgi:hypothetical protein